MTSRIHKENQMSVDQSQILQQRVRMSQNFINNQRNSSVLSNRVSWEGLLSKEITFNKTNNATKLCNKLKSNSSSTSISFYKPHNISKKYKNFESNKSSVSVKPNVSTQNEEKSRTSFLEDKRRQLIRSIDKLPTKNTSSRVIKHHRKNAQTRPESVSESRPAFGVGGNTRATKQSYIEMRFSRK